MDVTAPKCDEEASILYKEDSFDVDYVEFWKTIEASNEQGHKELRKLLDKKKVHIGDSIPNKEYWEKIKQPNEKSDNSNEQNVPEGRMFRLGRKIDGVQNETILRIILDNVCNGHELILHIFDALVCKSPKNECSDCFGHTKKAKIEVDLEPMFKRSSETELKLSRNKMRLVHDLMEIQNERVDDENIKKIFNHPVIEILILKKWEEKQDGYFHSVRIFTLFVFLFTFYIRLRMLESKTAKIWNSDENSTFLAYIKSNENITFTARILSFVDNTSFTAEILEPYDKNTVNFSDKSTVAFQIMDPNSRGNFTSTVLKSYDNNTFTAQILENPWLTVFNNKLGNVVIFATVMFGITLNQLRSIFWYFIQSFNKLNQEKTGKNERKTYQRRKRNMKMHAWNVAYLIIGNFVCFISEIDGSVCLKISLIFICIQLIALEIGQLAILVFTPAAKGYKSFTEFLKKVRQKRYWSDPENYLEYIFLTSVPLSMFVNGWELTQPRTNEERNLEIWKLRALCRGYVAMGVFAAWIDLVIKMGNVSHSVVGDFIKMFYNIIKNKLISYMQVCVLLITAFSLSFWVILEGQTDDNEGAGFSTGFWFSQVLTTTMSIGEFNTETFYNGIKGNGITKVFAMMLLIGLVCLSTITMINLLVAAIINDYNKMKDEVDEENLYFIAEYIIEVEKYQRRLEDYLPSKIFNYIFSSEFAKIERFKPKEDYCPHFICNNCIMEPLPIPRPGAARYNQAMEANQRKPLLGRLLKIYAGNENLCDYHNKRKNNQD